MTTTGFDLTLWRDHRRLWLPPLVLFVVTGALLSFYRAAYAGRLQGVDRTLAAERQRLEEVEARHAALARALERAQANEQGVEQLYRQTFATERERLTAFMREVRQLAERAGLDRGAISYPEEQLERHGLVRKSLVFSAVGDYLQLRQFINLLELSPSFVVLEQISVGDAGGLLDVRLDLSTLFVSSGREGEQPSAATRTGGGG